MGNSGSGGVTATGDIAEFEDALGGSAWESDCVLEYSHSGALTYMKFQIDFDGDGEGFDIEEFEYESSDTDCSEPHVEKSRAVYDVGVVLLLTNSEDYYWFDVSVELTRDSGPKQWSESIWYEFYLDEEDEDTLYYGTYYPDFGLPLRKRTLSL